MACPVILCREQPGRLAKNGRGWKEKGHFHLEDEEYQRHHVEPQIELYRPRTYRGLAALISLDLLGRRCVSPQYSPQQEGCQHEQEANRGKRRQVGNNCGRYHRRSGTRTPLGVARPNQKNRLTKGEYSRLRRCFCKPPRFLRLELTLGGLRGEPKPVAGGKPPPQHGPAWSGERRYPR